MYCIVVLRAIRGGEEAFVPLLSVLVAIVLALAGIAFLIYFIHHIATSIQASTVISSVAKETVAAIIFLFPEQLGEGAESDDLDQDRQPFAWKSIPASTTGYIQSVDADALLGFAEENNIVLRMERSVGHFSIKGAPIASVASPGEIDADSIDRINRLYAINSYRTVGQDAGFGIRQIVDIALKALSPAVNDTTTASVCVDYLGSILYCLVGRKIPPRHRFLNGKLRVIASGPTFESLVDEAFSEIRQSANANVAVVLRMLRTIHTVAAQARNDDRRRILWRHAMSINDVASQNIRAGPDRDAIAECVAETARIIGQDVAVNSK